MKLTKKDKMMLLILGVVILIAVFYMYGIKPAKARIAELDTAIGEKTAKAQEINKKLDELNAQSYDAQIAAVLDNYYKKKLNPAFHENLDKIALEQMMYRIFDDYGVSGYSSTGWVIESATVTDEYEDKKTGEKIAVDGVNYLATINTQVEVKSMEQFNALIDMFKESKYFVLTNYNISKQDNIGKGESIDPSKPDAQPSDANELVGSINLLLYMQSPDGSSSETESIIPPPLKDVKISLKAGTSNVVTFAPVEKATGYEAYSFITNEQGKREYTQLANVKFTENKETKKMEATILTGTQGVKVVIKALGNDKDNYDTLLLESSTYVELTAPVAKK